MIDPLRLTFNPSAAANDNGCAHEALKVEDFITDCVVLPQPFQDAARLERIFAILRKGACGRALLEDVVTDKKVKIEFNEAAGFARYLYTIKGSAILKDTLSIEMNPKYPAFNLAAYFSHELRHAQQCFANTAMIPRNLSPTDFNHYNRFLEADAQTVAILACFELMARGGDSLPFFSFIHTEYRPMCEVIQDEYDMDPESLETPSLRRKVFDAWFMGGQLRCYYDEKSIDNPLREHFSSLPRSALTSNDLARVAQSGGEKENYLTLPGFRALDDPYYTRISDPRMAEKYEVAHARWMKCPAPLALMPKNK